MPEGERVKLTLKAPSSFDFTRGNEPARGWNFITEDAKAKYVAFDEKLVAAFEARKCAGVEHEYVVRPDPSGRPPLIQEIVGVYDKRKGGGGGGRPGAPMLTDRQAALLAAVRPGVITAENAIADAEKYAAWLAGGGKRDEHGVPKGRSEQPARRAATPPASDAEPQRVRLDRLRSAVAAAFPGNGDAQKRWADEWCARLGIAKVDDATLLDVDAAIIELRKKAGEAA